MSRQQRPPEHDEGSALIMAIVFVTVIGLAMAAGLGYASATLRAQTNAYAPARDKLYAADAAMKAAVAYILNNPSEGNVGTNPTCAPVRDFGTVRGDKVTTQVCPQGTSLTPKGGGSSWGLQTLATGKLEDDGRQNGEAGLDITGTLQVNGNVYSNSDIVGDNLVVVGGAVKARYDCKGVKVTVDGATVPSCAVATPPASDPGYVPGIDEAPAAGSGTCDSKTGVASLQPGTWASQSAIDTAVGGCSIANFLPGVHYFDSFDWTIKQRTIAGKLVPGFTSSTAFAAACVRGGATGNGALLIFGGTATVKLSGSSPTLEVCGLSVNQPSLGKSVQLPIYGATTTLSKAYSDSFGIGDNPTGTTWVNPANAKSVDTKVATYSVAKNKTTNSLVFTNLTGANALPTFVVSPLKVEVTASSALANDTVAITVVDSSGTTLCTTGTPGKLTVALSKVALSLTCTKPLVAGFKLNLSITTLNSGSTRTVSVDGLTLSYTGVSGPSVKAQSGCVVATTSGCDFLSSNGNNNTFWFDGEVYLPLAKINVQLPNSSAGLTTLGMVVRVLKVKSTGSTSTFPIVAVDNGGLNDGDVTVIAKVGATSWMTCRVSLSTSGNTITDATVQGCTLPY